MIIDAADRFQSVSNRHMDAQTKKSTMDNITKASWEALISDQHTLVPGDARQIFADNLCKLLDERGKNYPRFFKRFHDTMAGTYESFRSQFGIVKNPKSNRLPARKVAWRNVCEVIAKGLSENSAYVTKEYVAHRITLGTSFHPTKTAPSSAEQVIRAYQTLATSIDHEFGLMTRYRKMAAYAAERNSKRIKKIMSPLNAWGEPWADIDIISHALDHYFSEDYLAQRQWTGKRIRDLSRDEQYRCAADLRRVQYELKSDESTLENFVMYLGYVAQELEHLLEATEPTRFQIKDPLWDEDFYTCSNALIGFVAWWDVFDISKGECEVAEVDFAKSLRQMAQKEDVIPLIKKKNGAGDGRLGCMQTVRLVLFPDENLEVMQPHIIVNDEECTHLAPLNLDTIASVDSRWGSHFLKLNYPEPGSRGCDLIELLGDSGRIRAQLISTASSLGQHPIAIEQRNEDAQHVHIIEELTKPISR